MELPPRIQAICWAQFWAWIGMETSSTETEHELTCHRMVPLPLLQHDMGRRNLLPL